MKCELCGNEYTLSCRRCTKRVMTWGVDGTLALMDMAKENTKIIESARQLDFIDKYYIGKAKTRSDKTNVFRMAMKVLGYKGGFGRIYKYTSYNYRTLRQRQVQSAIRWGIKKDVCYYCGSNDKLIVHHIVPVSWGGKSNDDNCLTLCEKCHREIHSKLKNYLNRSLLIQYLNGHEDEIKELASLSLR